MTRWSGRLSLYLVEFPKGALRRRSRGAAASDWSMLWARDTRTSEGDLFPDPIDLVRDDAAAANAVVDRVKPIYRESSKIHSAAIFPIATIAAVMSWGILAPAMQLIPPGGAGRQCREKRPGEKLAKAHHGEAGGS